MSTKEATSSLLASITTINECIKLLEGSEIDEDTLGDLVSEIDYQTEELKNEIQAA